MCDKQSRIEPLLSVRFSRREAGEGIPQPQAEATLKALGVANDIYWAPLPRNRLCGHFAVESI